MEHTVNRSRQVRPPGLISSALIRGLDLLAAGMGLVLLAPLFGVVGLLIRLTSPGPIFYRAERVGRDGRLFKLYKFRSMVHHADRQGPGITAQGDSRITRIGRILRRSKLDELPQLLNVLIGDMSLVGPRPEDPRYVALYTPEQRLALNVRPGMTSPASLHYREEEELLSGQNWEATYREQVLPHKLGLELAYLQRRTFLTDLALILETITTLVVKEARAGFGPPLRNRHLFIFDLLAMLLVPALALTLRLDCLNWWPDTGQTLMLYTSLALLVKLPIFFSLGLYRRYWRYAGVNDLTLVALAVGLSTGALFLLVILAQPPLTLARLACPRTVPLIDGLLTGLAAGGLRLAARGTYQWQRRQRTTAGRRLLIVGAGEAGTLVVRETRANPQLNLEAVAFVDDDPGQAGHSHPRVAGAGHLPGYSPIGAAAPDSAHHRGHAVDPAGTAAENYPPVPPNRPAHRRCARHLRTAGRQQKHQPAAPCGHSPLAAAAAGSRRPYRNSRSRGRAKRAGHRSRGVHR